MTTEVRTGGTRPRSQRESAAELTSPPEDRARRRSAGARDAASVEDDAAATLGHSDARSAFSAAALGGG